MPGFGTLAGISHEIGASDTVTLDCSPVLGAVTNRGVLMGSRTTPYVKLTCASFVSPGDVLIGTESQPFAQGFDFELTGAPFGSSSRIDTVTTPGTAITIDNDNGGLSRGMHIMGKWAVFASRGGRTNKTHLRDGSACPSNAAQIVVDDATGWQVGQQIHIGVNKFYTNAIPGGGAVTSTSASPIDRRTITSVSGSLAAGFTVGLNTPLTSSRYTKKQYVVDAGGGTISETDGINTVFAVTGAPRVVDDRPPVVNIGSNINIRGANDSAWTTQEFGVHWMAMRGSYIRMDGVNFERCGQEGRRGRYPIHMHQKSRIPSTGAWFQDAPGQYVKNCGVLDSAFRGMANHSTDGFTYSDNVFVNCRGNVVFGTETGDEEGNTFLRNTVMGSRDVITLEQAFDKLDFQNLGPSGFWFTTLNNNVIDNEVNAPLGRGIDYAILSGCTGSGVNSVDKLTGRKIVPAYRLPGIHRGNKVMSPFLPAQKTRATQFDDLGNPAAGQNSVRRLSPRDNGEATGTPIDVVFENLAWSKCEYGGGQNEEQNVLYTGLSITDHQGLGLFGVVDQFNTNFVQKHLSIGYTNNVDAVADSVPSRFGMRHDMQFAFAGYHGSLNFKDLVLINYPYLAYDANRVPPISDMNAMFNGNEMGGGIVPRGDEYLTALSLFDKRWTNWKIGSNVSMGWRMIAKETNPYSLPPGVDWYNRYGAGAGAYIVEAANPFYTSGITPIALNGSITNWVGVMGTKYFGFMPMIREAKNMFQITNAFNFTRVNGSGATIGTRNVGESRAFFSFTSTNTTPIAVSDVITGATSTTVSTVDAVRLTSGTWAGGNAAGVICLVWAAPQGFSLGENLRIAATGATTRATVSSAVIGFSGLSYFKHCAPMQGSRLVVRALNDSAPTSKFTALVSGDLDAAADWFTVGIEFDGPNAHAYLSYRTVSGDNYGYNIVIPDAARIAQNRGRWINTQVASIAAVEADATGRSVYFDTAAKLAWIKVQGGLTYPGTGPATDDDQLQKNIWVTVVPTSTTGGL